MKSAYRILLLAILILLAITTVYLSRNKLKTTDATLPTSVVIKSIEQNTKSVPATPGSGAPDSGAGELSTPNTSSHPKNPDLQLFSKATAKYMATLLSSIKDPAEQKENIKANAILYLSSLNLQSTEKQSGHAKTGLRSELVYESSSPPPTHENSLETAILQKFVLSLSAPSEAVPGRFNRQDIFLLGKKDLFEALVSELGSEIGKPPSKKSERWPNDGPEALYAAWDDDPFFHLFVLAEPADDKSDTIEKDILNVRLSIEEKID